MKRLSKKVIFIITAIFLLLVAGFFIWQHFKYKIARDALATTVKEQTDSLYTIKYDSLSFDAVTGHATMKNIRIIPDTQRMKNMHVENMPDMVMDVTIKSLLVTGVKTAKALSGNKLEGDSVVIDDPQIILYSMKPLQKETVFQNEASEFYKQILGKLDLIKVEFVFVNNVHVKGIDFFKKTNNFELINGKFLLQDVLIDSSHNNDTGRILFSKQAAFTIDSFFTFNHDREELAVKQVHFLGKQQKLLFNEILLNRFETDSSQPIKLLSAKGLILNGVNSNEIVKNKNLFIDTIICKEINIYELPAENLKTTTSSNQPKTTDSTGFTNVYSVSLKHLNFPKVTFVPFAKSNYSIGNISIKVNGVNADKIVQFENHPMNFTKEAEVNVDKFSLESKDKTYRYNFDSISINSLQQALHIRSFKIIPYTSEKEFADAFHFQKDRYDLSLTGLTLKDIDMNSLLDKKIEASELLIDRVDAKVFRDLHKPLKKESKVGNYPSQMLTKLDQPVNIKNIKIKSANVEYRENEKATDSVGVVKFTNASFDISNVTNIPAEIKKNNEMNIAFAADALGAIPLSGNFKFVLGSKNGDFSANGHGKGFDASVLNKVSIPMALVKIRSGKIQSLDFHFKGNNSQASGSFLMNYEDMKIDVLKRDDDTKKIKKRGLLSFAANLLVENKNSGKSVKAEYDRDIYKSFFNLVWKTLFAGMKETLGVPQSIGN
ncbi:MAG: hypothetical protein ABI136_05350 [Ginsengibacter sp.]